MTLREVMIAMGYREENPGIWLKPVGYHLFTVKEGFRWENWFRDIRGELSLYESQNIPDSKAL